MANPQILVVEDESVIAADIQDRLVGLGYDVPTTAASAEEALQKIPQYSPDLVLMDIVLQGAKDGIEAAAEIREHFNIPVVFLTAHADDNTLERAKVTEPFAYVNKPFEERDLHTAIEIALHRHKSDQEKVKLQQGERDLLEKTIEASIRVLSKILSVAEPQSFELGQKLRDYMKSCTESLKIEQPWELETAALLCRIGYVTFPAILIQKMRAGMVMTTGEKDTLMHLPEFSRNILTNFPRLESVAKIVYYQGKNFDGTGFPFDSVGGVNIPPGSRILRILIDLVHFETEGMSRGKALEEMAKTTGHYDPKLMEQLGAALATGSRKGKPIPLKDLCVGHVLLEPIETLEGTLVLNAGNRISPWMLKKLNNFVQVSGIREPIYIE